MTEDDRLLLVLLDGNNHLVVVCHRIVASVAPLLVDDATFLVYLLVLEEDELAPVVEHQETGVDDALTFDGSGTDMIYRLIDRGISIEVGTKLHADGLAPRHDAEFLALAREVLGTIESHVFQEVSQATLARFFQDGAYTLCDIEVSESQLAPTFIVCRV